MAYLSGKEDKGVFQLKSYWGIMYCKVQIKEHMTHEGLMKQYLYVLV